LTAGGAVIVFEVAVGKLKFVESLPEEMVVWLELAGISMHRRHPHCPAAVAGQQHTQATVRLVQRHTRRQAVNSILLVAEDLASSNFPVVLSRSMTVKPTRRC